MNGALARAVFVHGNAGSSHIWGRVQRRLDDAAPATDLPGFGAAERATIDGTDPMRAYLDYLTGVVKWLNEPSVLVGNGIGSVLCARLALESPDAIRGVVMTGPVGLRDGHARLGALSKSPLGARILRWTGRTIGRQKFLRDQLARPASDAEARRLLLDALREARGFHLLARLNNASSLAGLRDLRCPVTVLWGARDGVLPASRADEFMTYLPPHAKLEVLPGAGHALPLERPERVAAAIRELA